MLNAFYGTSYHADNVIKLVFKKEQSPADSK